MIRCFLNLNKVRLLQDSWMGQTSVERLHGRLDVLQTSFPPSPSWIQDGCGGNDVIQDLGRVFRPPLRRAAQNGGPSASGRHLGWPHLREPEMRSSKMATGSGRAAILRRAPQWGSKNPPYTTHDRPWISPWIKSISNELDITIHMITPQLSGYCDVINDILWRLQQNVNPATEARDRCFKIVVFIVLYRRYVV